MMDALLTPRQMIARALRGRRATKPLPLPARTLEQVRIDEHNIVLSRNRYFNDALDHTRRHHNAAPVLDELSLMQIQATALREAAEMVERRIQASLAARASAPPGQ